FKYRGATNAVQKLSDAAAAKGVVTHSSGNHAQALALAARVRGVPAYIVMPRTAPAVKKAAVEGYGGIVTLCEPTLPAREDDAARSKAAGRFIPQTAPNTIADGLLTSLGELTWPIIRDQVERVFTVTEDQIRAAMRLVWERMKLVIEPSAAVGVAVVLSDEFRAL